MASKTGTKGRRQEWADDWDDELMIEMTATDATPALTVRAVLQDQRLPLLERRMVLEHVLDRPRAWLIAHDDAVLNVAQQQAVEELIQRRLAGEPMAYVVGQREFMGLTFKVTPAVLIPRPDTELLVETALAELSRLGQVGVQRPRVLDIGTGSGAIAIAIKHFFPQAQITAVDNSQEALVVAQHNATELGCEVEFVQSDLCAELSHRRFDLIVSNPPYIAPDDPHLRQGDVRFEPVNALTDLEDGLALVRRIIVEATSLLGEGGALWIEHGWQQAPEVRELLAQARHFDSIRSLKDLAQIERVTGGVLKSP